MGRDDRQNIAAIDVGSNGMRIVIASVTAAGKLKEIDYARAAVRLGADVFREGRLSDASLHAAGQAFADFKAMLTKHDVTLVRAVATSAARNADNGVELVKRAKDRGGFHLEVIDGLEEAALLHTAVSGAIDLRKKTAIMFDMGGGSVEATVSRNGQAIGFESMPLGPVRLMQYLKEKGLEEMDVPELIEFHAGDVESLIRAELEDGSPEVAVATGGNIERLAKLRVPMLGKSKTGKVKIGDLESMIPKLLDMPIEQRIEDLGLRADRADIIAIAAQVLHALMDEADVRKVFVPGVGLKEGLLRRVARQVCPTVEAPEMPPESK